MVCTQDIHLHQRLEQGTIIIEFISVKENLTPMTIMRIQTQGTSKEFLLQ
jgi:hypothetical protein